MNMKTKRNRELVLARKREGVSYRELAKRFGISHTMVYRIVNRDWDKYEDTLLSRLFRRFTQ